MLATAMTRDADPNILGLLAETPQVKRMIRERAAAVTAECSALLRELQTLEAEAATEAPKLAAAIEKTTEEKKKAETALRAVDLRLSMAIMRKYDYSVAFSRRHDELEAVLRATASPLIAKFCEEMRDEWTKTRRAPLTQETAESPEKNPATGRREQYLRTNAAAVARRLRCLLETIRLAEELATSEADQGDANIGAKLGELASRLPPA